MKNLVDIYNLESNDSHKSFYGKAKVKIYSDNTKVLQSYNTDVAKIDTNGNVIRLWDGWSTTTGRHIARFCGLNKKEFLNLPLNNK